MNTRKTVDMTQGNIWKLLILVAVPLLLGNLFQQLYNIVDSIIVGRFVGKEALAAVGVTTPLCNTLVHFFNGVSVGAGVIISRDFGAKDAQSLHTTVETTVSLAFILGCLVTLISIPFVPFMLDAMKIKEELIASATTYMRIYFAGVIFLFVYNMGSSILRAVGDTRRPLYFLIISSGLNIILDLTLVVIIPMGIAGAAIATVIAEAVSAVLVCVTLTKSTEPHRLTWKDLHVDRRAMKNIFLLGLPVGIQQALTAFSNTFVQSYINIFSIDVIAGWSCHVKVDQFSMLPLQSISQTTTTFVSQNLGIGNYERAKQGIRTAGYLGMISMAVVSAAMLFTADELAGLFNPDPEVVRYAVLFILLMAPFRFFSAWNQTWAGALRGGGDSKGPMIIMLFSFVGCRQLYLFIVTKFVTTVYSVGIGYPVGWICCFFLLGCYYRHYGLGGCNKTLQSYNWK